MISSTKLLKAIRKNCLECSGGDRSEVVNCYRKDCPLYPYRMGVQTEDKGKR
jgi:hypothetical protein